LDPNLISTALEIQIGTPLGLVDRSEIRAALMQFPLIETYTLSTRPPNELVITIDERTPVGVIESDAGYTVVDAAGVVLSTGAAGPEGQPLLKIEGGLKSVAFQSAAMAVRSLPAEIREQLTEVSASSKDDVLFTLSSGVQVMWGSAERGVDKAVVVRAALPKFPVASYFDVSDPDTLIVR
jgi:cell division protein FtsQ